MFKLRREHLEAISTPQRRLARRQLIEDLQKKGFEVKEEQPTGDLVIKDKAGGRAKLHTEMGKASVITADERVYRYEYDVAGRLIATVDPAGTRIEYDLDRKGRINAIRRGVVRHGDKVSYHSIYKIHFDKANRLSRIEYPDQTSEELQYHDMLKISEMRGRDGHTRRYTYNQNGQCTSHTDPGGNVTKCEYDNRGIPKAIVLPDGGRQELVFEGESSSFTLNGNKRVTVVDIDENTKEFQYPDGWRERIKTENGRVVEAANSNCVVKFAYDDKGLLLAEECSGKRVEIKRSPVGLVIGLVTPDGEELKFERDEDHKVVRVVDWLEKEYVVGYDKLGNVSRIQYPNKVVQTMESTGMGMRKSIKVESPRYNGPVVNYEFAYDECDRLKESNQDGQPIKYQYDAVGRLVGAGAERYDLDANGNRVQDAAGKSLYNSLNQLMQRGGQAFTYDVDGNMTSGSTPAGPAQFAWNGAGQLIAAMTPHGVARYYYDAIGRRIRKECAGKVTRYTWAGLWLISEETEDPAKGVSKTDYLYLPERGLPIGMRRDGKLFSIHSGRLFEPLCVTGADAAVVWKGYYDSFGNVRTTVNHVPIPLRFIGQYCDDESGLHYTLARHYDPQVGRWLSQDPLRADGRCLNFYVYADGDPVNKTDPTGEILPAILIGIAVGAVVGAVIGAGVEAYRQYSSEGEIKDWGKVGKGALIGGVIGAIGGGVGAAVEVGALAVLGTGALAMSAAGAISGGVSAAAEYCSEMALTGKDFSPKEFAISLGIGIGVGAVAGPLGGLASRAARKVFGKAGTEVVEEGVEKGIKEGTEAGAKKTGKEVAEETAKKVKKGAEAIAETGILEEHAKGISKVARKNDKVIIFQNVNKDAEELIRKGAATKNMKVKAKSAEEGPLKGLIPADANLSKAGSRLRDAAKELEAAKKAAAADLDKIAALERKVAKLEQNLKKAHEDVQHAIDDGAKIVDTPNGKVLADKNGNQLTADYDMLAIGSKKGENHRIMDTPDMGKITNAQRDLVKDLNKATKKAAPGTQDVVHHGPANQGYPEIEYPVTAFTPDGEIHSIPDNAELKKFFNEQNAKGYNLDAHPDWLKPVEQGGKGWNQAPDGTFY